MKNFNSIRFSIILTNVFFVLLIILTVALPWMVTWYVQIAHRHENLVTTVMVTCYPCAPFTAIVLLALRKLLKNIENKDIRNPQNIKLLKYMVISCFIISIITLIAGRFYLPFYIVATTFMFLSLLVFAFKSISQELFK